jgi:hypothetical protein
VPSRRSSYPSLVIRMLRSALQGETRRVWNLRDKLGGGWVCLLVLATWIPDSAALPMPHYELRIDVDYSSATFFGEERIEFINETKGPLCEVFVRLYPNAAAIYGAASLTVRDVSVDGIPVHPVLHLGATAMEIPLLAPLPPGGSAHLLITFDGQAALPSDAIASSSPGYGILTKAGHSLTLTAFYPLLAPHEDGEWILAPVFPNGDATTSETATYQVTLTTTASVVPITTGRLVAADPDGEAVTYRFEADSARDFAIVLTEGHEQTESDTHGKTIRTSFSPAHSLAGAIAMQRAVAAVNLFEQRIGLLPYDEIDLVEVPLRGVAGVEFTGLILVSEEYAQYPTDAFFDVIISHETAHQWFYGVVGNNVIEDPWLDESLATYLSYVFLEQTQTPSANMELKKWERAYESARRAHPNLTIASAVYEFPDASSYSAFVYSGGAVLLDTIRRKIGDEAFFRALANYYRTYCYRLARPDQFVAAFEHACACELAETLSTFDLYPRQESDATGNF